MFCTVCVCARGGGGGEGGGGGGCFLAHTHTDGCTMIEDVVVRLYPSSYLPLGCRRRESELLNMEQEFGRGWVAFGTDGKRENKE